MSVYSIEPVYRTLGSVIRWQDVCDLTRTNYSEKLTDKRFSLIWTVEWGQSTLMDQIKGVFQIPASLPTTKDTWRIPKNNDWKVVTIATKI